MQAGVGCAVIPIRPCRLTPLYLNRRHVRCRMSVATPPLSPAASEPPDHIVLDGISWDFYERTLEEAGRSNLRITYDRGTLEMMTTSFWHEEVKTAIARLLEIYAFQTRTRVIGLGSLTCRRKDLKRGLEPDECY